MNICRTYVSVQMEVLTCSSSLLCLFFLSLIIYLERDGVNGGRDRERGRQRIQIRLHIVSAEPNEGLELMKL